MSDTLADITTRGWILALFIRDDGERFLLGDGAYDFKDSVQHFQPNTFANDVIELQGTDGQLIAGQVRRSATQTFDGWIGDATKNRQTIEQYRRDFLMFFRKNFFYKVIYIFPNGEAIQRKRGYIVDAPSVPELYQIFPAYHIGLNFEDPDYYEYAEDIDGDEIFANIREILIAQALSGGLIWDAIGAVSNAITWTATATTSGEYIQIDNMAGLPAPITDFEMQGNTEQTTYSGKNLLETKIATETKNGVAITHNADGTYTLNGTATAGLYFQSSQYSKTFPAGTYTFGISATAPAGFYYSCVEGGTYYFYIRQGQNTETKTFASATTISQFKEYLYINSGTSFSNFVIKPQIESGSTATSFEPYVGGTASPNPDYPQAVNTTTGENVVKITGKNLFDKSATPSTTSSGVSVAEISTGIKVSDVNGNQYRFTGYIVGKAETYLGKTFTLSSTMTASGTNTPSMYIGLCDSVGQNRVVKDQKYTSGSVSYTVDSVNSTSPYIFLAFYANAAGTGSANNYVDFTNVQLELGNQATTYEAYRGTDYEVNLGKNLFDINTLNSTNVSVSDGVATASAAKFNTDFGANTSGISLSSIPEQITLSVSGYTDGDSSTSHNGGLLVVIEYTDSTRQQLTFYNDETTETRKDITSNSDKTISKIYITYGNSGANIWHISKFMVEKGPTATTYAPYFTPIELCKIGTYQDRIYKNDGKWYIEKQVGKADLATLTWTGTPLHSTTSITDIKYTSTNTELGAILAEKYTPHIGSGMSSATGCIAVDVNAVRVNDANAPSGLAYYALATPTTTEITEQALIDQLDALKKTKLFQGQNNLATITLNSIPTLELEYGTAYDADGSGYEWEDGGGDGSTIISVAGVDNVQPIWEVKGPATNPTLTNITTGQTITWQSTVPTGQTLIIDMDARTATMAGANVFQFVSGDWIDLQPGNNKMSYTASNGATEPSTLSWNGVVG